MTEGYGNILTIFNSNDEQLASIETILNGHTVAYRRVENVFFLLIPPVNSVERFAAITSDLKNANAKFVLYYVAISDRSMLRIRGLNAELAGMIKSFLIDNN